MGEIEERWQSFWDEAGVYAYDPSLGRDETFVVDTPPPTVSGSLHVGHVFSYTHTDLMARFKRMRGFNVFYPLGWDDNGLPTERRVQNVFNVRCDPTLPYDPDLKLEFGRSGDTVVVSRRNFIDLCDEVVVEDERKFKEVFQTLGLSVEWSYGYATIDEHCRRISQYSFIRLIERGDAELREAPTMWDIDFQSAVAQAEVEDRERNGKYHRVRFGVEGGGDFLVATTRPELLPACIAVGAHPEDDRYRDLIGKRAITPLFEAPVPVISDPEADPERGTGIMMVCTFGDAADVEKWRALGVPAREVIARNGRIKPAPWGELNWESNDPDTAHANHERLTGLFVNQARREIVAMLGAEGDLEGDPEPTKQFVKYYERGERPLEFVVSRQWFIKVLDKKDALIEQGRKIDWHPEMFRKRYEDWVSGLNQDWSAARQRYFGVPLPVWYGVDDNGEVDYERLILPTLDDLPVDPSAEAPPGFSDEQRGQAGGFVGDPDVFDTWATSSLTPIITSGWPDDLSRHGRLYPTDLRPQAHDIIRTWAFYTIARSYLEDGSIPWHNVAISGWILDPDRKKMAKSKGNVVVPTEPLERWGADAVRYWSASGRLGVDTAFDPKVFKEGRRLVTKIRNAARLIQNYEGASGEAVHSLDKGLIARLVRLVLAVTDRWENWEHAAALALTESWFWDDLCDNYLELSKDRAYSGDPSALGTLRFSLDVVLRLFAPVLPFVTEEVYNTQRDDPVSIHRAAWPTPDEFPPVQDDGSFDTAVEVVAQIRKAKSEANASLKVPVSKAEVRGPEEQLELLKSVLSDVAATGNVEGFELHADDSLDRLKISVKLTPLDREKKR
jgi:valyl-tRNA synthetase